MIRDNNKGFTFIELLITLIVILILLAGVYNVFSISHQSYVRQEAIAEMHQRARASLEFMTREMRNIHMIMDCNQVENNSSIQFISIDDAGRVTGRSSDTLTDNNKQWSKNEWKKDTVAIIDGSGGEKETGSSTGSNTNNTLNDTNKSWTTDPTDQWQDYTVTIIKGKGYGQKRNINSNTATQLTLASNWSIIPDNTSGYRIWQTRTIGSNTATTLTIDSDEPDWATDPNATSFYQIMVNKGFSRNAAKNELKYKKGGGDFTLLSENITGLTLKGYKSSGPTTIPDEIKRIEITLTARTKNPDRDMNNQYHYYTVKTSVNVRN